MATIVITGANRGIGLHLARLHAERGDHVIAGCRRPEAARPLAELAARTDLQTVRLDVTMADHVGELRRALGDRPLDMLINNAGVIGPDRQSAFDMDFRGWLRTLEVNTLGPLRVTQALLPNLRRIRNSRIVTLSSRMAALTEAGGSDRIAYRSSKTALNRAMQALAADLADSGTIVVLLHPGWVGTDMGGPRAPLTPQQSATRLVAIMDALSPADSGRFIDIDGNDAPW